MSRWLLRQFVTLRESSNWTICAVSRKPVNKFIPLYSFYSTNSTSILSWLSDVDEDERFILETSHQATTSVTEKSNPLEVKLKKNFNRKNYGNIENIISKLQADNYKISAKCYYYLQFSYIEQNKLNQAISCLSNMKENQIEPIEENYAILLHGLIKENQIKNAEILFWQILEENENSNVDGGIITNTLINGLINNNTQRAVEITELILKKENVKLKIKAKITAKLVDHFITSNDYLTALEWNEKFEEINAEKIAIVGNKLIKSLLRFNNFSKSSIEEAMRFIQQMKHNAIQFDTETLNILLKIKLVEKNSTNLVNFFQEFLQDEREISPNEHTFQLLLLSFSNDYQFNFDDFKQFIESVHLKSFPLAHAQSFYGFLYAQNIFNNFFSQLTNRGRSGEVPLPSSDLENVYHLLKKLNIPFSSEIYASLIRFYFKNGKKDFRKIENLIADLKLSNIPIFGELGKSLMTFYEKMGNYESALAIYMSEQSNERKIEYLPAIIRLLVTTKYVNSPPPATITEIVRLSSFAYPVPLSADSFLQIFKLILKFKFVLWPDFLDFLGNNDQNLGEIDIFYNHFLSSCLKVDDFVSISNVLDKILDNPSISSGIELQEEMIWSIIRQSFAKGEYLFICKFYEQVEELEPYRTKGPLVIPLVVGEELIRAFLFMKKFALVSSVTKKWSKDNVSLPHHLQRLLARAGVPSNE